MDDRRRAAIRIGVNYAARLGFAYAISAVAATLVVIALAGNTVGDARSLFTRQTLVAAVAIVVLSMVVGGIGNAVNLVPALRWYARGEVPTPAQQRAALRIATRQTIVHLGVWLVGGAVFVLLNLDAGGGVAWVIGLMTLFGAATSACICHLLTQRTLRPVIAAAMRTATDGEQIPGVLARLMIIWVLFSALPMVGIGLITLARSYGWFVQKSAPVELPILVVAAVSLILGVRAMVLAARSISDPVGQVVLAMAELEKGQTDTSVEVYETSEIGRLQTGFNRMVVGLAERARVRELFGRHVGADVALRAIEADSELSGDVRRVGVMYIDLVGSTRLAASRPPREVALILNEFFQIVVAAVDEHSGLVNKFEGDAVLAVFGAPMAIDSPATAALATARSLAVQLRALPDLDFGVGVSAGDVFAGNIGAENRYEYTVIGDAVNEAARLADYAKAQPSRVVSSECAIADADADEQRLWSAHGVVALRGRPGPSPVSVPVTAP